MALTRRFPATLVLLLVSASLAGSGHARLSAEGVEEASPEKLEPLASVARPPAAGGAAGSRHNRRHTTTNRMRKYVRAPTLEVGDDEDQQQFSEDGDHFGEPEPPAIVNISPKDVDLCTRESPSEFEVGAVCGPSFSGPCFDRTRCEQLSVYLYDQEVCRFTFVSYYY